MKCIDCDKDASYSVNQGGEISYCFCEEHLKKRINPKIGLFDDVVNVDDVRNRLGFK